MTPEGIKEFLKDMSIAPDDQMDKSVLPRFTALADNEDRKAADLLHILDDCVHSSLCSDFCVGVMDIVWKAMLKNEGKTVEQGFAEATWRNEKGA